MNMIPETSGSGLDFKQRLYYDRTLFQLRALSYVRMKIETDVCYYIFYMDKFATTVKITFEEKKQIVFLFV